MSTRYGVLPSVIAGLENEDFVFNLLVAGVGSEHEAKQIKKQQSKMNRSGRNK